MLVKRTVSSLSQAQDGGSFVATADDAARWPSIVEFVSVAEWPDGERRIPGSLVLFVEDGRVKACLNDKDQGAVCFVAARGLMEVMDAAETILCNGTGDWRTSRPASSRKK